jgi:hypothetical protein
VDAAGLLVDPEPGVALDLLPVGHLRGRVAGYAGQALVRAQLLAHHIGAARQLQHTMLTTLLDVAGLRLWPRATGPPMSRAGWRPSPDRASIDIEAVDARLADLLGQRAGRRAVCGRC